MSDYNNSTTDACMDWNASLNADRKGTSLLPEGDYIFEVVGAERGHFSGSAKLPACNMINLTLQVKTETGSTQIRCNLILHRSLEWKLSSFFCCVGLKKKGQPFAMDWSRVPGTHGRARIKQRTFTGKDGRKRTVNDVDKFYDYDPKDFADRNDQWTPVDDKESINWD